MAFSPGLNQIIRRVFISGDEALRVQDTAAAAAITSLIAYVDQLEGYTDGLEAALTTINTTVTKNTRIKILEATDVVKTATYTLTGGAYRLDRFDYTAASVPGFTAREAFVWLDFGTKDERISTITWSII